jgi:PPP family 3-phenylpropionic acid transporter
VADRTRRPDLVLRLMCFAASSLMWPLVTVRTLPAMLFLYAAQQAFAVPIVGLVDAQALERVRQGADYGRIRVWGSLAFAVACGGLGAVLAARGRTEGDPLVPALIASALGCAFLVSLGMRGGAAGERPHARDVSLLLRDRRFLLILIIAPLHWACAAPYHGFLAILFQDRGQPPTLWGQAFALAVVSEMAALVFFRRLRNRFSLAPLLALAFAASAARWALVALVRSPALLVALQATHALTFGVFWAGAVAWVGECVAPSLRATGQTMFTAAIFGVGNMTGMLGAGLLYDAYGGAEASFTAAALVELLPLALVLAFRRLDPLRTPDSARAARPAPPGGS